MFQSSVFNLRKQFSAFRFFNSSLLFDFFDFIFVVFLSSSSLSNYFTLKGTNPTRCKVSQIKLVFIFLSNGVELAKLG